MGHTLVNRGTMARGHTSCQRGTKSSLKSYMGHTLVNRSTWHQGEGAHFWSEEDVELSQVLHGAHTVLVNRSTCHQAEEGTRLVRGARTAHSSLTYLALGHT